MKATDWFYSQPGFHSEPVKPYIADRHTREMFAARDEDKAISAEKAEIEAKEQEIREELHKLKLRRISLKSRVRANEQLKDTLYAETAASEVSP